MILMRWLCWVGRVALGAMPCAAQKIVTSLGWTYEHANQSSGFAELNGWCGSLSKSPLSLEVTPAEYVLTSQGGVRASSYAAAAGFQLSFGK